MLHFHHILNFLLNIKATIEVPRNVAVQYNHKQFRQLLKGVSSRTIAQRLKELEKGGIFVRQSYNEIPLRVEYRLTPKGQELVESIINLLQWMRKWSKSK